MIRMWIEQFASKSADGPFATDVHQRRLRRAGDDAHIVGVVDGVKRLNVLAVAVAEQESQGLDTGAEVDGGVPGLLRCPRLGRVGGDAGDVQSAWCGV